MPLVGVGASIVVMRSMHCASVPRLVIALARYHQPDVHVWVGGSTETASLKLPQSKNVAKGI